MKSVNLKGKGQRPHTNQKIDGKGKSEDPYFNYSMTILIGCSAEVTTRDGEVYEGIFVAFSAANEILLEAAHLVTDSKDDASIEKHFDVLVIPSEKVLSMKCLNADLTYPTREFATDTAISSSRGGGLRDKELTPWECTEDTPEGLSLDSGSANANGWEAKDMFKKNEEKYGVVSSFNHDLSGYTTQVDKKDSAEFKKLEEQAGQIAQEIEKGTTSYERTQVENGDEEDAYSAVVRPRNNAPNTTVNNNNNNNTSSVPNDKYIPPSRRQTHMQPSAPPPAQSHPPSNNNGPPHNSNNNSGLGRKPMYNQNQNPRNNYGAPPNAVYHQDRRFDGRRAPPPNQYGNPGHGDLRRPPPGEDSGPRPQRMSNKVPLDRKDPTKGLKDFGNNFRLQSNESSQRRPPGNPPPQQVGMPQHGMAANSASGPTRNPSPPSATNTISSNKIKKEESPASLPPLIPPNNATSDPATPKTAESSSAASNSATATTSANSAVSASASPSTPSVANISVSESTPPSSMTSSAASDNQTPSSIGDSKSGEESKKKFTFNPNAKEFNPKFTSRASGTPPRPPSTPAATQQVISTQAIHPYAMPISMQPILYAPAQQYAQAALTPSSNSSTSSGVATPRHAHRKGEYRSNSPAEYEIPTTVYLYDNGTGRNVQRCDNNKNYANNYTNVVPVNLQVRREEEGRQRGVVGMPPRSEMTPPIQMTTAGPPILAPTATLQGAPPHQYFVHQQGPYSVMRVVGHQGAVMPVFQTEGSGGTQIHPSLHYLPQNGGNNPNNAGHQQNSTPQSNPSAPSNVVPPNSHGYGQAGGSHGGNHPMGYPIVGLPVAYGFHQHQNVIQLPYVHSQGGTTTVIPQSQ